MAKEPQLKTVKVSDLIPDDHNANRGTERGNQLLEKSLESYGAGRSILLDKNGKIIAGNKTTEVAGSMGMEDVIIVPSDGTKLIAVQRMDLDLDKDEAAKALAVADNRVGEINLDWDMAVLADINTEIPLQNLGFTEKEIEKMFGTAPSEFKEIGEDIEVEHTCPKCGYKFSGGEVHVKSEEQPSESAE